MARSAWMFAEWPERTLYRDGQLLRTAVTRLVARIARRARALGEAR